MTKTKLYQFLLTLDPLEYRWWLDFLRSPYFNKNETLLKFGQVLLHRLRNGAGPEAFQAESIFTQVLDHQPYDPKVFQRWCNQLLELGERFLAQRSLDTSTEELLLKKLSACSERGLDNSYRKIARKLNRALEQTAAEGPELYWQKHQKSLTGHLRFAASGERTPDPFLQNTADTLDAFYYGKKLRLACAMRDANLTVGSGHRINYLDHFDRQDFQGLSAATLIEAFDLAYQLLGTKNDLESFDNYAAFVARNGDRFEQDISRELVNYAINYCIRQIRAGHREFVQRLLDLYQSSLRRKLLHRTDGHLCPWSYKNMVKLGLGLSRFDWVDQVVEQYSQQLPPAMRTDAYHFSLADLNYHRKQYEEAMYHLNRTEFSDVYYALGARTMQVKIYYETQEHEALESLLSAFEIYLRRHRELTSDTKSAYLNYVRFTQKMLRGKNLEKLKSRLQQDLLLTDRSWLLKQLP